MSKNQSRQWWWSRLACKRNDRKEILVRRLVKIADKILSLTVNLSVILKNVGVTEICLRSGGTVGGLTLGIGVIAVVSQQTGTSASLKE